MNQKAAESMLWRLAVSRPWLRWMAAFTPLKAAAILLPASRSEGDGAAPAFAGAGSLGDGDVVRSRHRKSCLPPLNVQPAFRGHRVAS
jgi:hypothetical protein